MNKSESILCQIRKMSKSELVGKKPLKMSEPEYVRILKNRKILEFENVRSLKTDNVRIFQNRKMSKSFKKLENRRIFRLLDP